MKNLTYLFLLTFFSVSLLSCSQKSMKVVTREDGGASLSDYNTYAWISDKENIPNAYALVGNSTALVLNNESAQKMVKEAVELQMEARGFAKDDSNPDMLINFQVLGEDTELRKYILDNGQDYLGFGPRSKATQMVPVDKGTVLINFMDATSGNQIWQGYAAGALRDSDMKNMSVMEERVGAIFEDFDFNQFETSVTAE
ncbi:DUF4136 domain-containing protein [Algoriphagus halophytocola]|uniref:DUF4136 domain-containing protein n=1 Tax=Algoriphagus halophytocola TaxID=2991499 RepID=A0ABY6MGH8_9BACT|nr:MULTISPECIES: DUF4136 domain-containing protein [unclassified Algoriphagus]UZD22743.1 DUF4136 domain-containing protein [Algoriphagus sp. TR-M5]WBL44008.1 DUF4136 domain-containing protein [Algoriphagus sp. TR-M9]